MKFEPLTEIEADVYNSLSDFVKRSKDVQLNTLLPHCFRVFEKKYSEEALTKAVSNLIKKRYFIQGSFLTKQEILQNNVRKNLLQYIQINPGAYNRLIRRELNLGSNEFNWHIGMLERFGFIKKVSFNEKNFGYFENKTFMGHEFDLYLLRNEKTARILKYLELNTTTLSQIAKDLEMHYSTVQKHLEILVKRELVKLKHDSKHSVYELNDDLLLKLRKIVNGQVFLEFAEPLHF